MEKTFWHYAKQHIISIVLIFFFSIAASLLSACMPFINRFMLDNGLMALDFSTTALGAIGLIAVSLSGRFCEYCENKAELTMCYKIGVKWKKDAFIHAMNLRLGYYKEHGVFRIIRDATFDIECILNVAQNFFAEGHYPYDARGGRSNRLILIKLGIGANRIYGCSAASWIKRYYIKV